jgi:hypothetical protein
MDYEDGVGNLKSSVAKRLKHLVKTASIPKDKKSKQLMRIYVKKAMIGMIC